MQLEASISRLAQVAPANMADILQEFKDIISENRAISNTRGAQLRDLLDNNPLNDNIISAVIHLLNTDSNQLRQEHFFVYFSPYLKETEHVRGLLDSDYRRQSQIHVVLHLGPDKVNQVYISDGSHCGFHFSYLTIDLEGLSMHYSDSKSFPIPLNLEKMLRPLLDEIASRYGTSLPPDLRRHIRHVQLLRNRGMFVPLQTGSDICGIAALLPCIATLDTALWLAVLSNDPESARHYLEQYDPQVFSDVSGFGTVLRIIFIKWLVDGHISIGALQRCVYLSDFLTYCLCFSLKMIGVYPNFHENFAF